MDANSKKLGRIIEKNNSVSEEEMHIWKMANRVSKIPPIDLQSWKSRLIFQQTLNTKMIRKWQCMFQGLELDSQWNSRSLKRRRVL